MCLKTFETLRVEECLSNSCFTDNNKSLATVYGCTEVEVGFPATRIEGHNKEFVDFMSYDRKADIFRCYEIKTSEQDLKSDAKLSFVGHLNYLVITKKMWIYHNMDVRYFTDIIEDDRVGIIICDTENSTITTVKRPTKIHISDKQHNILKDSLVRTLFYKYNKALSELQISRRFKTEDDVRKMIDSLPNEF